MIVGASTGNEDPSRSEDVAFTPPELKTLSTLLPEYEFLHLIGQGSAGAVYKGRQPSLNRYVAIKIIPVLEGLTDEDRRKILAEAQGLLGNLIHPNLVTIHDFGKLDPFYYIVMEFVEGATLEEMIRKKRFDPQEALEIVPQICNALQFAHQKGFVHRNLKPANIALNQDGIIKITDFGIAHLLDWKRKADQSRNKPWSSFYMAPEQQAQSGAEDHRADIYALGVIFYEFLVGQKPQPDALPPSKMVSVRPCVDEIIMRAISSTPDHRYQTMDDVVTAVETLRTELPEKKFGLSRRTVNMLWITVVIVGLFIATYFMLT